LRLNQPQMPRPQRNDARHYSLTCIVGINAITAIAIGFD
jgi:hypothetical protein